MVEKLGRMMDRSMEENLLAFVDGFDPPAQSTTSFTDRTSKGRLSSSMRIARQNVREIECATLQQDKEDFVDDSITLANTLSKCSLVDFSRSLSATPKPHFA